MRGFMAGVMPAVLWLAAAFLSPAAAAPVDPTQRDAALAVYHAFNKAVAAGKLKDALALRSAERRAMIAADAKTAAQ